MSIGTKFIKGLFVILKIRKCRSRCAEWCRENITQITSKCTLIKFRNHIQDFFSQLRSQSFAKSQMEADRDNRMELTMVRKVKSE